MQVLRELEMPAGERRAARAERQAKDHERRAVRRELRAERKGKFKSDAMPREAMRGDNRGGDMGGDG